MVVQLEWSDQSFGKQYGTLRFSWPGEYFLTINISQSWAANSYWVCSAGHALLFLSMHLIQSKY